MKTAIYGRYSENRGRGADILERQILKQRQFAQNHNYEVVKTYTDLGGNGHSLAREGLKELRKEAKLQTFKTVLVQDVPILCRNTKNLIKLMEEFKKFNINLIFTEYPHSRIFKK